MDAKTRQRTVLRSARAARNPGDLERCAEALVSVGWQLAEQLGVSGTGTGGTAAGIAGYFPLVTEPPVVELLGSFARAGHPVFLPVCQPEFQLGWVRWLPGTALRSSDYAPVWEPVGEVLDFTALGGLALLLVPALAVDDCGVRMGQGGGYYDRFLASLAELETAPPSAAVVYPEEVLPAGSIVQDPWDRPVDYALTPEFFRALRC